jgi:hypothetical protein
MTDAMTELALFELLSLERRVDVYGILRYYNTQGLLHREYGPAVVYVDGKGAWYLNGQRHRVDGPAVEYANGRRDWYQNGDLHRLDGPAIEYPDGEKFCRQIGRQPLDGPAIASNDGYRAWYQNGLLHRLDGPAVEWPDGRCTWHINGTELTQAEWQTAVSKFNVS